MNRSRAAVPARFALLLLSGAIGLALSAGCVTHTVIHPDALVRRSDAPGHRYEIQLVQDVASHGNLHNLNPVGKQEYSLSRWLYVDALEGEVPSDQIILALFRHGSRLYRPQAALTGTVRFLPDSKVQIALRVPRYRRDSTIERHVDFEFNGTYRLVPTTEPAPAEDFFRLPSKILEQAAKP